tara:strand:- start:281 stop:493 length:213 start_codon:yes stop_codon:yes gene_type:complete
MDFVCDCRCYNGCGNSLGHTTNDACSDSRMAYMDLAYCDCDSCTDTAERMNTCDDCHYDDNGLNMEAINE